MSTISLTLNFLYTNIRLMPKLIQDEFTNLPLSRQRKYQLRHAKQRLCKACSKKLRTDWPHPLCRTHYKAQLSSMAKYHAAARLMQKPDEEIL